MTRPRLLWLATGGTIAGIAPAAHQTQSYAAGVLKAETLLASLPGLEDCADIDIEQPFAIGSEHLQSTHWLALATRVRQVQAVGNYDGLFVTHGTDTLEETALFLDLVCPRTLPMVLTGAMRPATALSADGPMNLDAAVRLATDPLSRGAGPLVVMNDRVLAADRVAKQHTSSLTAFDARDAAPLAVLVNQQPVWREPPAAAAMRRPSLAERLTPLPALLPRVDILYQHVDADPAIVGWLRERGAQALVIAGTGHGTLAQPMVDALADAARQGCIVVRASRLPAGPVMPNAGGLDDGALGFIAARFCAPHKARLVLALALAAKLDRTAIEALLAAL